MRVLDCLKMVAMSAALASGLAYLSGCIVDGDDDDADVRIRDNGDSVTIDTND